MYLETLNLKFKISLVTKMLVNVIKIKLYLVQKENKSNSSCISTLVSQNKYFKLLLAPSIHKNLNN